MRRNLYLISLLLIFISQVHKGFADERSEYDDQLSRRHLNEVIQAKKNYFSCAGIGMIDNSALDGPVIFFKADNRELVCIVTFGGCLESDPKFINSCTKVCPPSEWKANECSQKYQNYYKTKTQ